ncbi:MAG: class II aldolase [Bacteroidetes bacterium]|nr:class II aldolase [Bacteroidota bacterium]
MTTALEALVRLSKYAGMRLDLVQAGGGNSSVKLADGQMLIKASGFWLSEVETGKGWSRLPHAAVAALLDAPELVNITDKAAREAWTTQRVQGLVQEGPRSSIETLLHAAIPQTYVLHTHPLLVNMVACRPDWHNMLDAHFPHAALVPYDTPGLELTLAMRTAQQQTQAHTGQMPRLYFLQNHGLIAAADTEAEIYELHEQVLDVLENLLNTDTRAYRQSNAIAHACNAITGREDIAVYYADADVVRLVKEQPQLLTAPPFCPDKYVFCGTSTLLLPDVSDPEHIRRFVRTWHHPPKVVLYGGHLYCIGANLRKCYEVADVLKFHLLVLAGVGTETYTPLPQSELDYLGGWEAEKYRQQR